MLTMLGGLAEFERELIHARTSEGRARAKERGQSLGRPHKLTLHQRRELVQCKEEYRAFGLATILIGRVAQPEDVAEAVVYLSSPAAGLVTGTRLRVGGGATAQ